MSGLKVISRDILLFLNFHFVCLSMMFQENSNLVLLAEIAVISSELLAKVELVWTSNQTNINIQIL